MSKLQDDASYAGSAIRLTNHRSSTTRPEQGQPTRRRSGRPPAPDHQQGHTFGIHPFDEPYDTDSFAEEGADYPGEPVRRRTSAVYQPTTPSLRRGQETVRLQAKPTRVINQHRADRSTLVIWLCLALIVMVGGWWLLSTVASWWQGVQENLNYGTPRTFQADHYVGLGDSPDHPDHFIALNLHGVIEVIQINPQDRTKDAVYVLASVGNASTPASLGFRDTTGSGHTDVIVTIGDSTPIPSSYSTTARP
ncbi:MAG TPA: hypothetical protein VIZ18_08155 [Ktedonobacteraceae bacterium]